MANHAQLINSLTHLIDTIKTCSPGQLVAAVLLVLGAPLLLMALILMAR